MNQYQIVYTSQTGNTEKLAKQIFETIHTDAKDIYCLNEETANYDADIYFIGFWTNRGSCSMELLDFLDGLEGKKVALFGTCGMGGHPEYFKSIETNILAFLDDSNEYLGAFMCQGEMSQQIKEKYHAKLKENPDDERIKFMIENFDHAIGHPNQEDLDNVTAFAKEMLEKAEKH